MKLVAKRVPEAEPPTMVDERDPIAAFTSESEVPPRPPSATRWKVPLPAWHRSRAGLLGLAAISLAVLAFGGYAAFLKLTEPRAVASLPPPQARLVVSSNPPGAEVLVDDVLRGVTPVSFGLPVGSHRLTVRSGEFHREVQVDARANMELVQHVEIAAPAPPAEPVTPDIPPAPRPAVPAVGTIVVTSPIEVQLFQADTLIGSSQSARLLLPAGRHTITAVNEALGFNRAMAVEVTPGGTTRVPIAIPDGTLSVNAVPWAEVFIDGRSLGQTPLGNVSVPIGSHELVFQHPQLGQRRQTIVVAAGKPTRVGVDMRN